MKRQSRRNSDQICLECRLDFQIFRRFSEITGPRLLGRAVAVHSNYQADGKSSPS